MPATPTGGLSIFINLTILLVGFIIKLIKKIGFKLFIFSFLYYILTDKEHDNAVRRSLGYSVAFSLFFVVSFSTSVSMYNRLTNESNYDIFAPKMSKVIMILTKLIKPEKIETPSVENKIADLNKLASNN